MRGYGLTSLGFLAFERFSLAALFPPSTKPLFFNSISVLFRYLDFYTYFCTRNTKIKAKHEKELYCNRSNYRHRDWNLHVVQRKLQSDGNPE